MQTEKTPISVFKDLYKSTDVPFIITLQKSFERIKQGTSKNIIDKIRAGEKQLKTSLPVILFSGEFSQRNASGLIKHSGLIVFDFDGYPDDKTLKEQFKLITKNKHVVGAFVSPSGKGVKAIVKVPQGLTKVTHTQYFKAFQKEFDFEYFDKSGSDVGRACYESHDPDIYINYDAETFEPEVNDEGYEISERVPILPITTEDEIIEKIMSWSWQKDFVEGERNAYVFDLASAFCEYGISEATAEGYIFNNVVIGDFSERETRTTVKSAYKNRDFNCKYFENFEKIERIKRDLPRGQEAVIKKYGINEQTFEQIEEAESLDDFWYYTNRGEVKVDNYKFKKFLESKGFAKYFPSGVLRPVWVQVKSSIVSETSIELIKDFVLKYLEFEQGDRNVFNKVTSYNSLFTEQYLLMLKSIELDMIKDTQDESVIAFQNGILKVTEDKLELVTYMSGGGFVWESQIIKRDYILREKNDNDYKTFINNISGNKPLAIETCIGYLLSTYKNRMNNKAVILNDEVISDNPEGGTGKGLFVQGLQQIRKVSILNGKQYDAKNQFANQTISQDSQIIVFDDVKKNFDFESQFSLVTEGITIERKNKDAIKLSVEDSPKLVISTNYAIRGEGNSHERRRHEIEIAQYYGKHLTPEEEFNRELFKGWSEEDFIPFDNYMIYCLQRYLKLGLVKQEAKNLKARKLIAETSLEFKEWIEDSENLKLNTRYEKAVTFESFTNDYVDFKRWLTRKKFNIWVQKYASYKGLEFMQGNSNGSRWFEIKGEEKLEEVLEEVPF